MVHYKKTKPMNNRNERRKRFSAQRPRKQFQQNKRIKLCKLKKGHIKVQKV